MDIKAFIVLFTEPFIIKHVGDDVRFFGLERLALVLLAFCGYMCNDDWYVRLAQVLLAFCGCSNLGSGKGVVVEESGVGV